MDSDSPQDSRTKVEELLNAILNTLDTLLNDHVEYLTTLDILYEVDNASMKLTFWKMDVLEGQSGRLYYDVVEFPKEQLFNLLERSSNLALELVDLASCSSSAPWPTAGTETAIAQKLANNAMVIFESPDNGGQSISAALEPETGVAYSPPVASGSGLHHLKSSPATQSKFSRFKSNTIQPSRRLELHGASPLAGPMQEEKSTAVFYCPWEPCVDKGEGFKRKADLERHIAAIHTRDKAEMVDCDYPGCHRRGEYGFVRRDKLMEHMLDVHKIRVSKQANPEIEASRAVTATPRSVVQVPQSAFVANELVDIGSQFSELRAEK